MVVSSAGVSRASTPPRSAPPPSSGSSARETLARDLDAELERDHGISLRAHEVLLILALFAPGGRLRMAELNGRTPLSQSRVSRLVAELEGRGFVERSPADGDGRGVQVSITTRGIEKFRAAQDTHLAGLERRLYSRLTERETRQLATLTAKILGDEIGFRLEAAPPAPSHR